MAYTRKRKRYTRRFTKKKRTNRKVARIGTVKRMIHKNEETKWKTVILSPNSGYDAPNINILNGLFKGPNRYDRIGNKVRLSSLEFGLAINSNVTNRGVNRLRMLIFFDRMCNGVFPTTNQIFADVGAFTTNSMVAPLNPDYWPTRFQLIKDRVFVVGVEGGAVDYAQEKQYKFKIPLKQKIISYNDSSSGDVTDVIKNSLLVIFVSDETVTGQPGITYRGLIRYKDA